MAVKTIGYTGTTAGDYTTVALWLSSLAATLTAAEEGQLLASSASGSSAAFTTAIVLNKTTSASNTLTLSAAAGGFAGNASKLTNALYPKLANGALISQTSGTPAVTLSSSYCVLKNLQISTNNSYAQAVSSGAANCTIDSCLLESKLVGDAVVVASNATPMAVTNTVVVNSDSGGAGLHVFGAPTVKNCTFVRPAAHAAAGNGIYVQYGSNTAVTNTAVFGFTTPMLAANGTTWTGSDYNATDQASLGTSIPGAHNLLSKTYSSQFQNTGSTLANSDFRLAPGSALIDAGTSTGAPAADVVGTSRPQGSAYDVGAWEAASAGGAALPPPPFSVRQAVNRASTY